MFGRCGKVTDIYTRHVTNRLIKVRRGQRRTQRANHIATIKIRRDAIWRPSMDPDDFFHLQTTAPIFFKILLMKKRRIPSHPPTCSVNSRTNIFVGSTTRDLCVRRRTCPEVQSTKAARLVRRFASFRMQEPKCVFYLLPKSDSSRWQ